VLARVTQGRSVDGEAHMPELPEVEDAAQRLRAVVTGRTIHRVTALHPSVASRLTVRTCRALRGAVITRVERRGKHQLLHLDDGRIIHVHFRMSGDWQVLADDEDLPRSARLVLALDDGTRVALIDPRALGTVVVHRAGEPPVLDLGPEATDPGIDPGEVHAQLARRRLAIKPALLDQRLLAGVGNIYAAEGLWHARIDPARSAADLTRAEVGRVLKGIRTSLSRAAGERYRAGSGRFEVYGRAGEACRRCRTPIARIVQAGRSTYYCPQCQAPPSRVPRRGRP
jgi:formamidopyrimidine-DNA glycosylase